MLGILRFYNPKVKYIEQIININGIKFLEISTSTNPRKAIKRFYKQGVFEVATNQNFDKLFKKYGITKMGHKNIIKALKYDLLIKLLDIDNAVFVYAKNQTQEILDFIYYLTKVSKNIYLDIGQNTLDIKQNLLKNYGVSTLDYKVNINAQNNLAFYFDKPLLFKDDFLVINLSGEDFPVSSICDIECETSLYNDPLNTTDVTAICGTLMCYTGETYVKIKKIKRNA